MATLPSGDQFEMDKHPSKKPHTQKGILATAWIVILAISLLEIILREVFHYSISESSLLVIEALIVLIALAITFIWKTIRPLRPFFGLFIVVLSAQWLVYTRIDQLPVFQSWLDNPSFNTSMLAEQILNLIVTFIVIAYMYILKRKRNLFFLTAGDTSAPAGEVKWLGIKETEKWSTVGGRFAIFLSLGTLAFLIFAGRPPVDIVFKALPFLPAVLACAALNAFNEEMTNKASFLAVLEEIVGKHQALLLLAAFFGLFHFYGIPYGIIGVLMAAFLGWFLGKSMLETRGIFWAWLLHFLQDVLIFAFLAIGSISAGG
jgi:uncharacterized protein